MSYYLLIGIICLSCFAFLIRTLLDHRGWGWSIVSGGILLITGVLFYLNPQLAGIIGGSLWGLFLILPLWGCAWVNQLIYQERYGEARKLALCLRWLHPADGWFEQPFILETLEMGQQGKISEAIKRLHPYETSITSTGRNATALLFIMGAQWQELLQWIEHHVPERVLEEDAYLVTNYLRALGETGDLNGLLWGLERYEGHLSKSGNPIPLNLARLFAFAFCGQVDRVCHLLAEPLVDYPSHKKKFWRLTAQMAAGQNPNVEEQFLALQESANDFMLKKAIAWRLSHPPQDLETILIPFSWQTLKRLQGSLQQERRYGTALSLSPRHAKVTCSLIALNILFFALEVAFGGSKNTDTLDQLGALMPYALWHGEWWRSISANFLHYGALHLFSNMVGLYFLGPFVEAIAGGWRYLFIYFGSGIGAMYAFSAIAIAQGMPYQRLVGASAAIMGILGAILAILLQGWLREKSQVAAKRLRLFLAIVALQVTFDFLIPEVSFLAHALGLGLGFTIAMILFPQGVK
ncbi:MULTISPECIES: rhomboid family intramembrane serine protease [Spirulina sp. CCY15215]|uniref:rhomboid family intramembrane serine protease n=1 Tax=Spirulina sp. CCY15215 TaxID=2767591 RepID=UPI00195158F4|nr:rhomboid family intramembrane serine protease [Spirulina major]